MRTWVVTGPIGSGKTSVTSLMHQRGAAVVDADKLGHDVLLDATVVQAVGEEFGWGCVVAGKVDRKRLGTVVFSDPVFMTRLNAITHPPLLDLVSARLAELAREGKHELAVLEAAVYFLWPPLEMIDLVVVVKAPEEVRLRRLVEDRGLTSAQAQERMKAQDSLRPFWDTADVVLNNNGDLEELKHRVHELMVGENL